VKHLLQLLSCVVAPHHQLFIVSVVLVRVQAQSQVVYVECEFVCQFLHLLDAASQSVHVLLLLLLLLEVFAEHLEMLHLLVKVELVVGHDVVELRLRLLVPAQLVLQTLEYLLLRRLLPHVIIARLSTACLLTRTRLIILRWLLLDAVVAILMGQIQILLQLVLVLLKFHLHQLLEARVELQENRLHSLLIQE